MALSSNSPKERLWLKHIRRWQRSRLNVRAFCEEHQLSEPSFYVWRRTLVERGLIVLAKPARTNRGSARLVPLEPVFVPVRLKEPDASIPTLEVILAEGRILRVPPGFDAATLRRLLEVLEGRPC